MAENDVTIETICTKLCDLTIEDVRRLKQSLIYIIRDESRIVYIGKTINPRKRFESYKYLNACHNKHLANWLKKNTPTIDVLLTPKEYLAEIETFLIKKHKATLFNIIDGDVENWKGTENKPWFAASGVRCPSDIILTYLKNHRFKGYSELKEFIKNAVSEMTVINRVLFELGLAQDFYNRFEKQIERWLWFTERKITKELENACA